MTQYLRFSICGKAIVIFFLFLFCGMTDGFASGAVRKDSIHVWGKVKDLIAGNLLDKGVVTVYNERDSIVLIDTLIPKKKKYWGTYQYETEPGYDIKLPQGGEYKIRFDIEGYISDMNVLSIPDKQYHKFTTEWKKDFTVMRKPKEQVLGAAVVRATKIKMVVKGDTVEYDADAFNVAEGSMLDKLIDEMPGLELKENGEIYSNGQKVESLLVNGKDFFSGDPNMALQNLPAYTVKKVQVYRKDEESSYLVKDSLKREEMKKLVLNVKLKKEYNKGWIFNTDFAYGTKERYVAKAVAIHFTDAWKFLAFTNINNLNMRGGVGDDGNFWGRTSPQGIHRVKDGGMRAMYSKEEKIDLNVGLNITHADDFDESATSSETYLTTGNTYSRSRRQSRNHSVSGYWWNWMGLHLKKAWVGLNPLEGSFSRSKGSASSLSATFNDNPLDAYRGASLDSLFMPLGSERLEKMLLNTVQDATQSTNSRIHLRSHADTWLRSPIFGNTMNINYNIDYNRNKSENFQHYMLDNRQTDKVDKQNVYSTSPSHSFSFSGNMYYNLSLGKKAGFDMGYRYNYNYNKNRPERYRLDSLAGWDNFDDYPLGRLPSMRDSMLLAMDTRNSYNRTNYTHNHRPWITGRIEIYKKWIFELELPMKIERQGIKDTRANNGQYKHASMTGFEPTFAFVRETNNEGVISHTRLAYNTSRNLPSMSNLLDLTDNTNPLFISKGNANLRNQVNNSISFDWRYGNAKHVQNYGGNLYWGVTKNLVGSATTYDRSTGVTTYQPRNVNGNWTMRGNINVERSVDKNDRFMLRNNISGNYDHSVDYTTDYAGGVPEPFRSVVHNYNFGDDFRFTYRYNKYMVSLRGNVNWRLQNSTRANFNRVNAVDFSYGVRSHGPIVWGFEYETNLMVYSRRGYNDASMNDNNIIWGLNLQRSFLKGKNLTLRLEAHDLLGQISNVRTTINTQGRTETWYNSIPRFVLMHVCYKFNTMTKKKAGESQE